MNILTLSIKQKYFDEILAGTKTIETRELRPPTEHRFYRVRCKDGKEYPDTPDIADEDIEAYVPVWYDALKLYTGAYKGKRPWLLVEVKKINLVWLVDENGDSIEYKYKGDTYTAANIEYELGKVLETSVEAE